jgi:alkylation response protein AidB-like acyl-CoA dehydrogenase
MPPAPRPTPSSRADQADRADRAAWPSDPEAFRPVATAWLAAHTADAPSNYGAIVPEAELAVAVRWHRGLADAGLIGLHWPRAWGGQGLTGEHTGVWLEECAHAGVPPFLNMVGLVLTAEGLLRFGTDEQKAHHLPPLRTAERVWCQLFSEPGAGSDLAHLTTRAERDGDGWRLTGEKVWCSNGHIADWGICLARSDPDAPAHRGVSFFLVDMRSPGVECRPLRQMTGVAEFDQVILDGVALPGSALLGQPGGGWAVAMSTLTHERNHIGASIIGLQQRLTGVTRAARTTGGARLDRAVALWCRGQIAGALQAQPERLGPAGASLMKLAVAELAFDATDLASRLAGPAAQIAGPEAAALIAAPGSRIAGGTSQVQKTIIAERLLGLPKEPAVNPPPPGGLSRGGPSR